MSEIMPKTLLEKDYKKYMSIIMLTWVFQDKTPEKGLALKHYRYCLVQKQDLKPKFKKEIYKFFERPRKSHKKDHTKDDLTAVNYRMMCERKEIEKCISSRQNLIKTYLNPLKKAGILINISLEQKHPVYRINPQRSTEIDIIIRKKNLIDQINHCSDDDFLSLEKEVYRIIISDKYSDDYFIKINKAHATGTEIKGAII
jgi:hypothetical protein